jgi:hypothetical protein
MAQTTNDIPLTLAAEAVSAGFALCPRSLLIDLHAVFTASASGVHP